MVHDVLIAGAGPAGCVAAVVLARAGARVLVLDRAQFPRDKPCGDTLNPGAVRLLQRLGLDVAARGAPLDGMLVTGPDGTQIDARYPAGAVGRAMVRRDLDQALLERAAAAGASVDTGTLVEGPVRGPDGGAVAGLLIQGRRRGARPLAARLVIAADGRGSRLARALSLAAYARRPRRWAVGAYFTDVGGLKTRGEMHLRHGLYIGVAPLPGGLANACVVTADRRVLRYPAQLLTHALARDQILASRFATARMVTRPVIVGPLAVECTTPGTPGMLLAGDAAGFVDPMTGDGLRFALRGAELAAEEALRFLEHGDRMVHLRLKERRRREFAAKMRFNRMLRSLVASAPAMTVTGAVSRISAWPVARIVRYAGDIHAV